MSLSINNSPFVNVDKSVYDRSPASADVNKSALPAKADTRAPVRSDCFQVAPNNVIVNGGALTKLFDMFDMVFRAMREVLSGRNIAADVLPQSGQLPGVKPDARQLPVTPDKGNLPLKPQQRDLPGVKLPMEPRYVDPAWVRPDEHEHEPHEELVLPPHISVNNDAKANVHVNVNVGHCHCPDTQSLPDGGLKPRVLPDVPKPVVEPRLNVKPWVTPRPKPEVKPGVTPSPRPEVELNVKPWVTPRPKPEVKPGVTPSPRPEVELNVKPWVTPRPKPEVKPGVTPSPRSEVKLNMNPDTTPSPKPEVQSDVKPNVTPTPEVTPQPAPPVTPDLTSPAPTDNRFDPRSWRFAPRPKFMS
ncbi:hypothetical protein A7317_19530 [Pseudomonas fluorescens]|uniref:hypothetical protein n=1 Tax=Pseudomonas fluorescens TaxID=294 RepID=UPI00083E0A37|nr:hypothetical protein [Pseudomonas fluorescens]AOE69098.1 hypothetical protein A7317_19530 [Pseudomonas fluorescens]AOE74883.1 hypothetical protein A7319_19345 [Pseudomonas fluorescens]